MMKMRLAFLAAMALGCGTRAADDVLIIESYHADYQWDKDYKKGIQEVLKGKYNITSFEMDTKRVSSENFEAKATEAWEKYKEVKPKLVFLGDDNALKFLVNRFSKTETPVVFLGINKNPRDYYDTSSVKNITGVLERPLAKRSLAQIKQIVKPTPKKILVLFDNGTTSQAALSEIFKGKSVLNIAGMETELKLIGDWGEWQNAVNNARKDGFEAAVIGLYHTVKDKDGKAVDSSKVLEWTSSNLSVPTFGFWSFSVGPNKTAGGLVLYGKEQGKKAAELALEILGGTSPNKISPVVGEKGRMLFSESQLKKYNIKLPENIKSKATITD